MYCSKCGKLVDADAAFCKFCGAPVSPEKNNETNTGQQAAHSKADSSPGFLSSVDFQEVLRQFILTVIFFVKWFFYFTLTLVVLLVFIPYYFPQVSADLLWYKLLSIGLVLIFPVVYLVRHWSKVSSGWSLVRTPFANFYAWLYKKDL